MFFKKRVTTAICLSVLFVAGLMSGDASGQASSTTPGTATAVSLPHLYWHFLLHQNHLDKVAITREQQGKDGNWLRNYYQQRLGFTDSEYAPVRASATALESDLKKIDDEVQSVISAERAKHPRVLASPGDLPPVPPRLIELRDEREAVIQRDVDNLKNNLGAKLAAKMDEFLETDFAPNVKVQRVGPPRPHDPTKHTVLPFATGVQK